MYKQAQAATEVAVFGAVIIFLIGMIIRFTISSQYTQNQNFKAMRVAMAKSLESANQGKTERNNATVLYIEDRLVPDFNKFGSLERTPFFAQGGASMSPLVFYPIDEVDVNNNIPKIDVYINGQYYPFTTAALLPKLLIPPADRDIKYEYEVKGHNGVPEPVHYKGWDYQCKCSITEKKNADNTTTKTETCYACPIFYKNVPNGTPEFCSDFTGCSDALQSPFERFDLNRNGNFDDDQKPCAQVYIEDKWGQQQNIACWDQLAWQWGGAQGVVGDFEEKTGISALIDPEHAVYPTFDIDGDRKEETIYGLNRINLDNPTNSLNGEHSFAPDMVSSIRDQLSKAIAIEYKGRGDELIRRLKELRAQGIITDVMAFDAQDGDIDLTFDNTSSGQKQGMQPETAIYTRNRRENGTKIDQGTYFLVKEGKLFNPETGDMVRSVNKRDQIDLVERHVILSNNTWRFCMRASPTSQEPLPSPPPCIAALGSKKGECEVADNPVEVCVNDKNPGTRTGCFSEDKVALTCFDTASNMLYVRSRIQNKGGHKWITDITDKRPAIQIR